MTFEDECRAYAAECMRLAELTQDERDKASWLSLAQLWLDLAQERINSDARSSRADQRGSSPITDQARKRGPPPEEDAS
jgi:hypothetical protein